MNKESRIINYLPKKSEKNLTSYFSLHNSGFGFTLIELLVVISILGLLAGLVISNMAGVRERARDAERKSDLGEIQKALEMYKHDQTSPAYPYTDWAGLVNILKGGVDGTGTVYMKNVPNDPLGGVATYVYTPIYTSPTGYLDYTLYACLENKSDAQGKTDARCSPLLIFELKAP